MKLLVIKTDKVLSQDERGVIFKELRECIENGIIFMDSSLSYDVVEFDSFIADRCDVEKKNRRQALDHYKNLTEMRRRFNKVLKGEENDKNR